MLTDPCLTRGSMTELEAFMKLFSGRTDVYGSVEGKSNKLPVTEDNYRAHLEGKVSLGVYPLLDDGNVNFFAIDLDEKNWDKALLIRNEMWNIGVPMYICESKSKGFHIYGFGSEPLVAKEVREVVLRILGKLGITCEVFPKQDKLDEIIRYGNYINLPIYGNTRQFQDADHKPVPFATASSLIQYNTNESILKAKEQAPPYVPKNPIPALEKLKDKDKDKDKSKEKKSKSPPCVVRMLKGVESGMRDEAAFALARHYIDQGDIPEEIVAMLLVWDAKNKPPIGDMRIIQTKVQSASNGYAFGCNSITEGILSGFCVGKANCDWLKREVERKTKSGLIQAVSYLERGDMIYEEIIKVSSDGEMQGAFIACDLKTGTISEVKEIQVGDITCIPILNKGIMDELVKMPSGIEEYGTIDDLIHEIENYIHHYSDFSKEFQEWASWWVLMTWVYDRLPSVSYLRFLGDWGTGKSRALDTVGGVCYKRTKITGAVTAAAIYRVLDRFRGTLIIDENDMENKSEIAGILTKILNSGIERGSPIIRCLKEDETAYDIQTFQVFGPKLFATRNRFEDMALESRCLTTKMQETSRPINVRNNPDNIPFTIYSKEALIAQDRLRNKLLLFRFRHLSHVPKVLGEDDCLDMDLGKISGRLKQVCLPFATIFRDNPETMDKFRRFLERYQKEIYGETSDSYQGRLVAAVFKAAISLGKDKITCADVAREAKEEGLTGRGGIDLSALHITKALKGMNIKVRPPQHADVVEDGEVKRKTKRYIEWDLEQMQTIYNRYQPGVDKEELIKLGLHFEGPTF